MSGPFYFNRRSGRPSNHEEKRFPGIKDTGGKDQFCYDKGACIIVDDHAGICASAAYCGAQPVIVASDRRTQQREGIESSRGPEMALEKVFRLLTSADSRALLIRASNNLRAPRVQARTTYEFGDISEASPGITADDFKPYVAK